MTLKICNDMLSRILLKVPKFHGVNWSGSKVMLQKLMGDALNASPSLNRVKERQREIDDLFLIT